MRRMIPTHVRLAFVEAADRLAEAQDAMTQAALAGRGRCLNYSRATTFPPDPGSPSCDLFNDTDDDLCMVCFRKRQNRENFLAHRQALSKARADFRRAWKRWQAARGPQ